MKVAKACQPCRVAKRRCFRTAPGKPCSACMAKQLKVFKPARTRLLIPSLSTTEDFSGDRKTSPERRQEKVQDNKAKAGLELLSDSVIENLVENYLVKIHDRPHSLFHPPTLRQDVRLKHISRALLCALCSMGCRFSTDTGIRRLEPLLTAEAKRLLKADIENISLENIQTCILAANLSGSESKSASEALFFRIANSMAQIMGLPGPVQLSSSIIQNEVRRRVWWSLFMADHWCSSGLGLPRQMRPSDRAVDLPMDEALFHSLAPDQQEPVGISRKPGLWAHMITLVQLFGPIQDLNQRVAANDINGDEVDRTVASLARQLQAWEEMLPPDAQFNDANLAAHCKRRVGGPFVALHLGFHHYSTLLYFQFLETSSNRLYVDRCKHHAKSYSALLKRARQEGGCEAVYPTVGHMATVSSSVLVHILLFGETDELAQARDGLNSNFEALLELKKYWPSLTSMQIDRLVTFQNMCLLSADHTHQLDRWMVHFLIKHALPLEPKAFYPRAEFSASYAVSQGAVSLRTRELADQGRFTEFTTAGL
ncbi:Nonribosomal peptide synthetase 12 [Pleurostoma richardsiae]|uniref:Nonribosomal peptide synthetase 12 n=1 Tax=Pleurostoma richardsiae TaxID=41990 RepID=A0AA38RUX8_9PEZI|nr:Nonribosomal peptide synthetase 12 [Pleurostoma richardsiae]